MLKFLKSGSPRKSIEQLVKKFYNSVDPHVLSYSPSLPQFALEFVNATFGTKFGIQIDHLGYLTF